MLWLYHICMQVPHMYNFLNHVRVGTYLSLLYTAFLLIIMGYAPGVSDDGMSDFQTSITNSVWAGIVPVFLLGMLLSHYRLRFYHITVLARYT